MAAGLPFLVLLNPEDRSQPAEQVVGYAYASGYRWEREAYHHTVEITLMLKPNVTGKNYGRRLLHQLIQELRHRNERGGDALEGKIREVVAIVASEYYFPRFIPHHICDDAATQEQRTVIHS